MEFGGRGTLQETGAENWVYVAFGGKRTTVSRITPHAEGRKEPGKVTQSTPLRWVLGSIRR